MAASGAYSKILESAKANLLVSRSLWKPPRKKWKNWIASNKCDICTLDIIIDFHWNNEANQWRSEVSLIHSYADSLISVFFLKEMKTVAVKTMKKNYARQILQMGPFQMQLNDTEQEGDDSCIVINWKMLLGYFRSC